MRVPRPSRVRTRLTLLFGLLFTVSGAILLTITYLLVAKSPRSAFTTHVNAPGTLLPGSPDLDPGQLLPPEQVDVVGQQMAEQAARQHDAELQNLLVHSLTALAIMVAVSLVLGWLLAGRILRPLRTMTTSIQQISAHNVHDRLAATGPRDEMRDLSDTVDGLLERLETALDAHKRFVANAAHELRTPLTLEHALIEETLTDSTATVESFRSTFERLLSIRRQQARMLESLLTLASSERGLDRHEPVELSLIARQAAATYRPAAQRRDVRLESEIGLAWGTGDPALVERLVANLLDNAIAYNVPGGWVRVSTGSEQGHAVLTVANSGRAIPPEQVDRLFEPFQRLDRTRGREGHHGLGLSIVRAIALAHHAELEAQARVDGGLVVRVVFPVPVAASTKPHAEPALAR
ncbi:sensor histidine kinase [Luedemannella helvata]|uniref:histidine kinase n=1 Tax=Luedemannella helvata TaxID=349315 RepID=A0ABP4X8U6_9ACTN